MKTLVLTFAAILVSVTFNVSGAHASLLDGLSLYYPFNGNAIDESGNGNNGIVHGAVLTADRFGHANNAYHFNGVNSYINANNNQIGNLYNDATLSFWFKAGTGNFSGGHNRVLEKDYLAWWDLIIRHDSTLYFSTNNSSQSAFVKSSPLLTQGKLLDTWNMVTIRKTGSLYDFFVNGIYASSMNTPYNHVTNTATFTIGRSNYWHAQYFDGDIDDVRIYDRALSGAEITQLASVPEPPSIVLSATCLLGMLVGRKGVTRAQSSKMSS